jgi:hypothetical protein
MKRNLIFLLLLLVLSSAAQKQKGIVNKKLPCIQFEELEYDFGDIKYAEEGTHRFYFSNKGKGPLIIESVHKS